jgi:3'-5' exoribonuclease
MASTSRKFEKTQFISRLRDKEEVRSAFLLKYAALGTGKNGKPFMNLVLMDSSGEIEARIWEDAARHSGHAVRDAIVLVTGKVQSYQGRLQVVVASLEVLREDEVALSDLLPKSRVDAEALYPVLLEKVASMRDPHYRALAEAVLRDDAEISALLKRAPAAKAMHHAYPGGLLEHIVSITQVLDFLSLHYAGRVDRDLLFLGGFFHDIAKIWELTFDKTTDYSNEGRLVGHLVMGVELVERKIRWLESQPGRLPAPFPQEKKLLVKHLILAHHGKLEYGSPVVPQTLEALIVHYIDDLDSKVNQIGEFMVQDSAPGDWTLLNKHHNRFFYKAGLQGAGGSAGPLG